MRAVRAVRETEVLAETTPATSGRLIRVVVQADAAMRGGRALLALKRAEALGHVNGVRPSVAAFETPEFDGLFSFRLHAEVTDQVIEAAIRGAGDIESVQIGEAPIPAPVDGEGPVGSAGARHIRVDLRRLDSLINNMGELVVARGRLAELVAQSPNARARGDHRADQPAGLADPD